MRRQRLPQPDEQWVDGNGSIIGCQRLKRKAEQPLSGEKRQFERIDVHRRALATELDTFGTPGPELDCTVVNISRGGLCLNTPRMVYSDRRVVVEVPGQPGEQPRVFFGVVRQVRYVEGRGYFVGIQFEPMPRSGPLDRWMSRRKVKSN